MAKLANISLIGNLGSDPEMRFTPNGKAVTQFSVAIGHSKPDGQGGWIDEGTDWYRVSVWGNGAERAAEQLHKGNQVYVSGRLKTRTYEAKDGGQRFSLDVDADTFQSLERRDRSESADDAGGTLHQGAPARAQAPRPSAPRDSDDLPF